MMTNLNNSLQQNRSLVVNFALEMFVNNKIVLIKNAYVLVDFTYKCIANIWLYSAFLNWRRVLLCHFL